MFILARDAFRGRHVRVRIELTVLKMLVANGISKLRLVTGSVFQLDFEINTERDVLHVRRKVFVTHKLIMVVNGMRKYFNVRVMKSSLCGTSLSFFFYFSSDSENMNIRSHRYGDMVNPVEEPLPFQERILGNVVLENDGSDVTHFETLEDIQQIVGHIVIHDNKKLKSMNFGNLNLVHGNIEIMHNPNLKTIELHPDLELVGCLKFVNNPMLDSDSTNVLLSGRFRKCNA